MVNAEKPEWVCPLLPGPLKVLDIRTLFGANYFSGGPVVIFRVDLGEYDEVFTNEIEGFYGELKKRIPTLKEHHCSENRPGGFFFRVEKGTLLGHVSEHTAIELQTLAGMEVGYGKTRSTTEPGVYNVVCRFFDEVAGIYALTAAVNLVNSILKGEDYPLEPVIRTLVEIREQRLLGPSTQALVDEASERKIPYQRLDEYNLVQLGTGRYRKWIRATLTSDTSLIAVETADDKLLTLRMLQDAGIPVPETIETEDPADVLAFSERAGGPLTLKPTHGHLGEGITVRAETPAEIEQAFGLAASAGDRVLVQPFVQGQTYRLLVIDYLFTAAVRFVPPFVTGDGKRSLGELIEALNADPRRGVGDKEPLTRVEVDEQTLHLMALKGISPETILPEGEVFVMKVSGNLRLGGGAVDVTDQVHPVNRFLAERAARAIGLNVAGIDVISTDIGASALEGGARFIEVNAAPDFRMHMKPTEGAPRPAAKALLDMLFPEGSRARVPLFSVTGTLGKTTAVNLLAHCLRYNGHVNGVTTTEGLFIDGTRIMAGDMTYPEQVSLVLRDPTIDCAVLETSREGILRRGLGYRYADAGIVLNMFDDHVGSDDIKYLEDLAYAKSVVAEQVYEGGHAVLNADQPLVMEMAKRVHSKLVLFSRRDDSEVIRKHVSEGGTAVALDVDRVVILTPRDRILFLKLEEIPLTFEGKALFNFDAVLASIAALFAYGLPLETIRQGMRTFTPTPATLPGRMNWLRVRDFDVLLDYAHNGASFEALKAFLDSYRHEKLGVLDAAGDRSDEEILALGRIAAETYDTLYLYEGYDLRGRKEGEITNLLRRGAAEAGFRKDRITRFSEPEEAWRQALAWGMPGRLVVLLSPRYERTLKVVREFSGE